MRSALSSKSLKMKIRRAAKGDARAIRVLILSVSHFFLEDLAGKHAERFYKTVSEEAIAECIEDERFVCLVAEAHGKLVGMLSIKDNVLLYHLFVAEQYQKQGVASALWRTGRELALRAGNPGHFQLNATPYAVPVYKQWGFRPTGERLYKYGVDFVPMRMEVAG